MSSFNTVHPPAIKHFHVLWPISHQKDYEDSAMIDLDL